jgi:hypothetical protein
MMRDRIHLLLFADIYSCPTGSFNCGYSKFFYEVPVGWMTRDLVELAGINPLGGALSSLGIFLWLTSASVWLFLSALCWKLQLKELFWFALYSGLCPPILHLMIFSAFTKYLPRGTWKYLKNWFTYFWRLSQLSTCCYLEN